MPGPNLLVLRDILRVGGSLLIVSTLPGVGFTVSVCISLSYPFSQWVLSQSPSVEESLCYFLDFSHRASIHVRLMFGVSVGGW